MKKIICFLLIGMFCCSFFGAFGAEAEESPAITVMVNGNAVTFDQPPVMQNDRVLVPLRAIFEALDAYVYWVEDSQTILSGKGDQVVMLQVGNNRMYVGENMIELDVPAQIIGDRTLVPVRAISEAFGAQVDWDQETYTVIVTG